MSTRVDAAAGGSAEPALHRGLVTGTLVLSSMIYSIDWTIAAVALPHMQGTSAPKLPPQAPLATQVAQ